MIEIDIHRKLAGSEGEIDLHVKTIIQRGEFVTIYGPSGAGKTSVLRMLAGLLKPGSGKIIVSDTTWYDSSANTFVKPQHRSIGMVFQEYSLFPNMTVRENLEFALDQNGDISVIEELLDTIELKNLQDKRPSNLSGGQKQRIAVARALIRKPSLLLLDEPLSALDTAMRLRLQDYILEVHKTYGLTTILVSHDLNEIRKMSDRVLVLEGGVLQSGASPAKTVLG